MRLLDLFCGAGAQAVGSAITYARRYALVAALGLAPDDDDDGAQAQQAQQRQQRRQQAQQPPVDAPDERAHTNAAWHAVHELFPDEDRDGVEAIWWQIRERLRIPRDHALTAKEADDVVATAAGIAEGKD